MRLCRRQVLWTKGPGLGGGISGVSLQRGALGRRSTDGGSLGLQGPLTGSMSRAQLPESLAGDSATPPLWRNAGALGVDVGGTFRGGTAEAFIESEPAAAKRALLLWRLQYTRTSGSAAGLSSGLHGGRDEEQQDEDSVVHVPPFAERSRGRSRRCGRAKSFAGRSLTARGPARGHGRLLSPGSRCSCEDGVSVPPTAGSALPAS
mmetsp:Transcript_1337/g.2313  ORF Transcript_1337/g.2313 Transcript_1337/m.2313 type:complete len:205 (+) Transcript_1337:1489-2103(+)